MGFVVGSSIEGRYRLIASIELDERCEVFRAEAQGRPGAVLLRAFFASVVEGSAIRAELDREAIALCRVAHQNVAGVLDFGVFEGRPYLVTELVEGVGLAAALRSVRGVGSQSEAVRGLAEVQEAIDALHAEGLVHGALRGASVVIDPSGCAKIIDAGVARIAAIASGGKIAADPAEDLAAFDWLSEAWLAATVRAKPQPVAIARMRAVSMTPRPRRAKNRDHTPVRRLPPLAPPLKLPSAETILSGDESAVAAILREGLSSLASVQSEMTPPRGIVIEDESSQVLVVPAPPVQDQTTDVVIRPPRKRPVIEVLIEDSVYDYVLIPGYFDWVRKLFSPKEQEAPMRRTLNLALTCGIAIVALIIILGVLSPATASR